MWSRSCLALHLVSWLPSFTSSKKGFYPLATQGSTGLIPVSSQKSISAGYKSRPYPRHAYSLVQLSSIFSISQWAVTNPCGQKAVSYTHLRAHETRHDLVCRLLLEKKKKKN